MTPTKNPTNFSGGSIKIKKTYVDYMKDFYIGKIAYFIELDQHGYEEKIEEITRTSSNYDLVVIKGDEELQQQEHILNYLKTIKKINPNIKIQIYIDGTKKPKNTIIDVEYIVRLTDDIDEKVIQWLIKADANFIFEVKDEDDIEHVNTIVAALLMKKTKIYIHIKNNYKKFIKKIKLLGYNIYIKIEGEWC